METTDTAGESLAEDGPPQVGRIQIPVSLLEFDVLGDTLWVHSPIGATVLRIKSIEGFAVIRCLKGNPVSHLDVLVDGPIDICLANDAE